MTNDVVARLAAANPVPGPVPAPLPGPAWRPVRRRAFAAALAVAAIVPALAFAGQLDDLLGISNEGAQVPESSVLPAYTQLDHALQEMNVGATMQSLGTLDGVAFYATRNAAGHFCLAIDRVAAQYDKGVLCDLNDDNFPSDDVKAISFPGSLLGVAADGVANVELIDADGNVIDSAPVENNLFVSGNEGPQLAPGSAAYLETLDSNGNVLTRQKLPG